MLNNAFQVGPELIASHAFSAASTNSLTTKTRFGVISAEMASLSSASSSAFFFAFGSSLMLELVRRRLLCFSLSKPSSPLGLIDIKGSLPFLFSPGIAVALAGRMRANAPDGPCETLRLIRSLNSTLSSVFSLSFLRAAGRFAGAPGFDLGCDSRLCVLFFGGRMRHWTP